MVQYSPNNKKVEMYKFTSRLVSAYEDKVLGLSDNGEIFQYVRNKTFSQFVDYILNEWKTHQCNEHWQPQYMHCDYCDISYDIVGRVETLEDDLGYVAFQNNFTNFVLTDKKKLHFHRSGINRSSRLDDLNNGKRTAIEYNKNKTIRYFSLLNTTQLDGLYKMYQIDFEMFGYLVYPYVHHYYEKN